MLSNKIEYIIRKYHFDVSEEINNINKILRVGQNFADLFDGETFYKGLWNRMTRIKLAAGFDAILSHKLISKNISKELHSLHKRFQRNYFEYIELLSFAFESKISITPEALEQLLTRFKKISQPLDIIHDKLEEILEDIPKEDEPFIDDEIWEDFS